MESSQFLSTNSLGEGGMEMGLSPMRQALRRKRAATDPTEDVCYDDADFATPRSVPAPGGARGQPLMDARLRPYPPRVQWVRDRIFRLFMAFVFGGTAIAILVVFATEGWPWKNRASLTKAQIIAIPVISVAFTWWHVWLGIKMCFFPVHFVGCCKPVLGWQGIVPRRSGIMAERACDIMVGRLITIEEIIDRLDPVDLVNNLHVVLTAISRDVLDMIAERRCSRFWHQVPESVKQEIAVKSMEESMALFDPILAELKLRINEVFDLKAMCVDVLQSDLDMIVEMFQKLGRREFVFITHFSAVMGFFLGVLQIGIYFLTQHLFEGNKGAQFWVLPVSGLINGYLTNWLGINLIFRPVRPHPMCGGYVNFQGVFLKRQWQVAGELSTMVCQQLLYSKNIIKFVVKSPNYDKILAMYREFANNAIDQSIGAARNVVPRLIGSEAFDDVKEDVVQMFLDELPKHTDVLTEYTDRVFDLENTMRDRLRLLPPEEFEGMLHPVFQEDEWMILLLGAVLGTLVGIVQSASLGA